MIDALDLWSSDEQVLETSLRTVVGYALALVAVRLAVLELTGRCLSCASTMDPGR